MTTVIQYRPAAASVEDVLERRITDESLYHHLFLFLKDLDGFEHQDMLKVAAAMDCIKRKMHQENN